MAAGPAGNDLPRRRARRVVELTRQMVRLSRDTDWEGVVERNRLRQREAEALFHDGFPEEDREYIRSRLAEALAAEGEVRERMTAARDEFAVAMRDTHLRHDASDAYRRFSAKP